MISSFYKKRKSGEFLNAVVALATGTVAAQAISLLVVPALTRIYGPEQFGILGVFLAAFAILSPVATLCYSDSLVIAEEEDVGPLMILGFSVGILMSLFLTFGTLVYTLLLGSGLPSQTVYLLPLALIVFSCYQLSEQLAIRKERFGLIAKGVFSTSVWDATAKIGIGLLAPLGVCLVAVQSTSRLLAVGIILKSGILAGILERDYFKRSNILQAAKKYKDFAIYRAPQLFINGASQSLPVLLLAFYYGMSSAGYFAVAKMAMSAPSTILGKAVSDVFYPKASRKVRENKIFFALLGKVTLSLALLGVVPFAVVIFLGPDIFRFVFGDGWQDAGEYAAWLAIWFFFVFINAPSLKVIPILRLQKFHLLFTIFTLFIRVFALMIAHSVTGNDLVAVAAYSLVAMLGNIFIMVFVFWKSKTTKFDQLSMY